MPEKMAIKIGKKKRNMLKACKESRHMEIDGIVRNPNSRKLPNNSRETSRNSQKLSIGAGCTDRLPGRRPYSMGARMVIPSSCAVGGLGAVQELGLEKLGQIHNRTRHFLGSYLAFGRD